MLIKRAETVCSPNVYELMLDVKKTKAKSYLGQARERVSIDRHQILTITSFSDLSAAIVEHAKRLNVDLIIISDHGHSGIRRQSGSVAERVVRDAPCATLVVRRQEKIHKEGQVRMGVYRDV